MLSSHRRTEDLGFGGDDSGGGAAGPVAHHHAWAAQVEPTSVLLLGQIWRPELQPYADLAETGPLSRGDQARVERVDEMGGWLWHHLVQRGGCGHAVEAARRCCEDALVYTQGWPGRLRLLSQLVWAESAAMWATAGGGRGFRPAYGSTVKAARARR
jgi:hypothetical protein